MVKVNTIKKTMKKVKFFSLSFLGCGLVVLLGTFFKAFINPQILTVIYVFCLITVSYILYLYITMKIFIFENTGSIFFIKQFHPLSNKYIVSPKIQIPTKSLIAFTSQRKMFCNILYFEVKNVNEQQQSRHFSIRVSNISQKEIERIRKSFFNILSNSGKENL